MDENLLRNRNSNLNLLDMPTWMNSNKYILSGYRPTEKNVCFYGKTVFTIHNETINIWTHLLGTFTFIGLLGYLNSDTNLRLYTGQAIIMNLYVISCCLTYLFSSIMHTFYPINECYCKKLQSLDYVGIGLQIFTTLQVFVYYCFYCQEDLQLIYMNVMGAFNILCLIALTSSKLTSNEYKNIKVCCFLSQCFLFVIPMVHRLLLYENNEYDKVIRSQMVYFGVAFIVFALCIIFYLGLIPERFVKGKSDIVGHSHQIFHILSVLGSVIMFIGIKQIMDDDSSMSCSS